MSEGTWIQLLRYQIISNINYLLLYRKTQTIQCIVTPFQMDSYNIFVLVMLIVQII